MKVITCHGHGKPAAKDLETYQTGWNDDASEETSGVGTGKTLYIKDADGNVVPVVNLSGYLKEQFLYNLPGVAPSDVSYPDREYTNSTDESFFGLTAGLNRNITGIVDENGNAVGNHIVIDFLSVDPSTYSYQTTSQSSNAETVEAGAASSGSGKVRRIEFDSISKEYIAKLKNALEQKAVYTVETKATEGTAGNKQNLSTLLTYLLSAEVLAAEAGVQAVVKADETNNNDTWLYVLVEDKDADEGYSWQATMPLEYQFHDPVAVHGLKVYATDDTENTVNVGLSEDYLHYISRSIYNATFKHSTIEANSYGETNQNILTFTPNGSEDLSDDGHSAFTIDLREFVLDCGSY